MRKAMGCASASVRHTRTTAEYMRVLTLWRLNYVLCAVLERCVQPRIGTHTRTHAHTHTHAVSCTVTHARPRT